MESRMLTTAMLTQLNDLRRKQKCLFFIATNRLRSFDAAVIRPGRFDALVFVGSVHPSVQTQMYIYTRLFRNRYMDALMGHVPRRPYTSIHPPTRYTTIP
jgi:ATP-dependent 26S proteasome regulatory subunit